jgi:competence protein ComEC
VVVHIRDQTFSLLFTGDMERSAENTLLGAGLARPATILKVAHHGSATSSSPEFLRAVRPKVMVISCGTGNRYGHPSPGTLAALEAIGGHVHRTDRDGALWIRNGGDARTRLKRYPPRSGSEPAQPATPAIR